MLSALVPWELDRMCPQSVSPVSAQTCALPTCPVSFPRINTPPPLTHRLFISSGLWLLPKSVWYAAPFVGRAKLLAGSRKESVPRQESRGRGEGSEPRQTLQAELTPALRVLIVLHKKVFEVTSI